MNNLVEVKKDIYLKVFEGFKIFFLYKFIVLKFININKKLINVLYRENIFIFFL